MRLDPSFSLTPINRSWLPQPEACGRHPDHSSSMPTILRVGRSTASTTAPGSGRIDMILRPRVVSSSDRFLVTCSTVRSVLHANLKSALLGVSIESNNFACSCSCCSALLVATETRDSHSRSAPSSAIEVREGITKAEISGYAQPEATGSGSAGAATTGTSPADPESGTGF